MTKSATAEEEDPPASREPLTTRELFLDTEIYHRLGFDPGHPSFVALKEHIRADRLALHHTDITKNEIERQLAQLAREAMDEIGRARATAAKWQKRAPQALGPSKPLRPIDKDQVASEAVVDFNNRVRPYTLHNASHRHATDIFRAYFEQRAPFDGSKSKSEFPDAFVVAALAQWCAENNTRMYVVTADKAMQRAARHTPSLIPLKSLDELLEAATIEHSPDILETVEEIVGSEAFIEDLGSAVDDVIGDLGLVYMGDLYEGEATEAARSSALGIVDWTVISAGAGHFGLIVDVVVDLLIQVHFEDTLMASYDSEDGILIGTEPSDTEEEATDVEMRLFIEVLENSKIVRKELLTEEINIYGSDGWDR